MRGALRVSIGQSVGSIGNLFQLLLDRLTDGVHNIVSSICILSMLSIILMPFESPVCCSPSAASRYSCVTHVRIVSGVRKNCGYRWWHPAQLGKPGTTLIFPRRTTTGQVLCAFLRQDDTGKVKLSLAFDPKVCPGILSWTPGLPQRSLICDDRLNWCSLWGNG